MIPQPNFDVGDKVWAAELQMVSDQVTCPDCVGEKHWTVNTPAGETFRVKCLTCREGYQPPRGYIVENSAVCEPAAMTIGSVRINTNNDSDRGPVEYMLRQTGVGAGTVWREQDLYASREQCEKRCVEKRKEHNVRSRDDFERRRQHAKSDDLRMQKPVTT